MNNLTGIDANEMCIQIRNPLDLCRNRSNRLSHLSRSSSLTNNSSIDLNQMVKVNADLSISMNLSDNTSSQCDTSIMSIAKINSIDNDMDYENQVVCKNNLITTTTNVNTNHVVISSSTNANQIDDNGYFENGLKQVTTENLHNLSHPTKMSFVTNSGQNAKVDDQIQLSNGEICTNKLDEPKNTNGSVCDPYVQHEVSLCTI